MFREKSRLLIRGAKSREWVRNMGNAITILTGGGVESDVGGA